MISLLYEFIHTYVFAYLDMLQSLAVNIFRNLCAPKTKILL